MKINVNADVEAVLRFMQENIAASKLVSIAERLPETARLLWDHFPQEPCVPIDFQLPKVMVGENQSLPISTE
jgi:uncharacterized protein (DUF2267 family)